MLVSDHFQNVRNRALRDYHFRPNKISKPTKIATMWRWTQVFSVAGILLSAQSIYLYSCSWTSSTSIIPAITFGNGKSQSLSVSGEQEEAAERQPDQRHQLNTVAAMTNENIYADVNYLKGLRDMDHFMSSFFKNIDHCRLFELHPQRPLLLNVSFGCNQLFRDSGFGTGNFITGLYGLRVTARVYEADLMVSCDDAIATSSNLVLPYFRLIAHVSVGWCVGWSSCWSWLSNVLGKWLLRVVWFVVSTTACSSVGVELWTSSVFHRVVLPSFLLHSQTT